MVQKEVAERIASGPGTKKYGILSVLLQAYFDIEILFHVSEKVFTPPPKVKSSVMKFKRNDVGELGCEEKVFTRVVKKAFNQRRKALRNSLKSFVFRDKDDERTARLLTLRPEQTTLEDFIYLAGNVITEI
jgi:16S rRNA (adenine1518-N6/adenine1519-N6)-dimethyltransferase